MNDYELFCKLSYQKTSHDLVAGCGYYCVILENLSDRSVQQGETVAFVNLHNVPSEGEMKFDYGGAEGLRKLRVCSNDDIISITYSSCKPV